MPLAPVRRKSAGIGSTEFAPYATRASAHGRREHAEPADPLRNALQVDRRRVIDSTAFRRLEHKTQVFAPAFHDHFRTRLTHTLEVAEIARTLARLLRANQELAEVIALAHDLGHPPFGHAGEAALAELMAPHGGFNHNTHSLRVVEYLEHPYPGFRGLNLTVDTLEGLRAHETRYDRPGPTVDTTPSGADADTTHNAALGGGRLGASVEAQVASMADRLAYNLHDLEDAIGAELIEPAELEQVELWKRAGQRLDPAFRNGAVHAVRRPILAGMLDALLGDVVEVSLRFLSEATSPEEIRHAGVAVVALSLENETRLAQLEVFLHDRVYRHQHVAETDARGREVIRGLFHAYTSDPGQLPPRFRARVDDQGPERVACDYIAGMTDRFGQAEFDRMAAAAAMG